ncbi:MAG: peptidase E, partial [Alphaproteobacteria bacterium]|nr:peptidase E [Alphaproteobacteria bacterium]
AGGADPALEDFMLSRCAVARPRIGYIGAASGDDPQKTEWFDARFAGGIAHVSHLPQDATLDVATDWIVAQDIVYVGGGNTAALLRRWRVSGLGTLLCDAGRRGVLLAGVSAGAICWFEWGLSDSGGAGLAPLAGLGLIPGSCCPHYSSEADRRPVFPARIAARDLPNGVAIDDGVAVLFAGDERPRAFSARPGCWAYEVARTDAGEAVSAPLAAAV